MREVVGLAVLLAGASCASYAPLRPADATQGRYVRVHLSETAAARLTAWAGTSVRVIEGRVVGWEQGDRLLLERRRTGPQGEQLALRELFPVAREDILQLEERHIARGRTALLAGGAVAAAGVLIWQLLEEKGVGGNDGDGGGPTAVRLPVRIPIR